MKRPPFERQVCFRSEKALEVNRQNQNKEESSPGRTETGTRSGSRTSTTSQNHEFSYRKVPAQMPVVDVPPLPAKYFRQFPQRDMPVKNRAPIEEGVKAEEILDRILEGKIKVIPKELWAVAPKLQAALKKILTSKRSNKDESREDKGQEKEDNQPQKKVVSVNSLESPEKRQEVIEIENSEVVEVWAVADPVLQFLEKLSLEERSCQIFAIEEEGNKEERVAPDMAHLRVVPAVINGVGEEEVLLDSGSQIVLMTKKVAAANKVSWDPSLSIQMQSMNGSLSRMYGLARNVPFTLEEVMVFLQVHVMDMVPYTVLLGRPFNTITESRIVNDKERNQTVCITCPNTGTKVAIPIYKRGELPWKVKNLANFW